MMICTDAPLVPSDFLAEFLPVRSILSYLTVKLVEPLNLSQSSCLEYSRGSFEREMQKRRRRSNVQYWIPGSLDNSMIVEPIIPPEQWPQHPLVANLWMERRGWVVPLDGQPENAATRDRPGQTRTPHYLMRHYFLASSCIIPLSYPHLPVACSL